MNKNFYTEFESAFHADPEVIKNLRKQYLSYIKPIAEMSKNKNIIDLGCGRGEWLELTKEVGFRPYGVDIDEGMLSIAKSKNLPCHLQDAIEYIQTIDSASQAIVSAFHVIEHIEFKELATLFSEAFRTLVPGGLLILETPNMENLFVATQNFYLDHTHIRPIPILQLCFLAKVTGFSRYKIIRLHEADKNILSRKISIVDIYYGTSRDYAIIAQKDGDEELHRALDSAYSEEVGISIDSILKKFDQDIDTEKNSLMEKFSSIDKKHSATSEEIHRTLNTLLSESSENTGILQELKTQHSKSAAHIESKFSSIESKFSSMELRILELETPFLLRFFNKILNKIKK